MGPFQITVLAPFRVSFSRSIDLGPMSRPCSAREGRRRMCAGVHQGRFANESMLARRPQRTGSDGVSSGASSRTRPPQPLGGSEAGRRAHHPAVGDGVDVHHLGVGIGRELVGDDDVGGQHNLNALGLQRGTKTETLGRVSSRRMSSSKWVRRRRQHQLAASGSSSRAAAAAAAPPAAVCPPWP